MPDPPPRRFDRPQALFDAAELQTVLAAANHDPAQLAEAAVFYRAAASALPPAAGTPVASPTGPMPGIAMPARF